MTVFALRRSVWLCSLCSSEIGESDRYCRWCGAEFLPKASDVKILPKVLNYETVP
jgi:predicted amidophosphoribosyltransferase